MLTEGLKTEKKSHLGHVQYNEILYSTTFFESTANKEWEGNTIEL